MGGKTPDLILSALNTRVKAGVPAALRGMTQHQLPRGVDPLRYISWIHSGRVPLLVPCMTSISMMMERDISLVTM